LIGRESGAHQYGKKGGEGDPTDRGAGRSNFIMRRGREAKILRERG